MALNYSITELKELAERLVAITNLPYDEMTHSFFKRRLALLYENCSIRKTQQFITMLEDEHFVDIVNEQFSIAATELFRDPGYWRKLRGLINDAEIELSVGCKVLIPGILSGEELYSFLILIEECGLSGQLQIKTSHNSMESIKRIQNGFMVSQKVETNNYNYKRFEGSSKLENYFVKESNQVCFKKDLLKSVEMEYGFFPAEQKEPKASIVIFRNKMLYYNKAYHDNLMEHIDKNTKAGGIVCFGIKERLPNHFLKRFECIDEKESIYRKYKFLTD